MITEELLPRLHCAVTNIRNASAAPRLFCSQTVLRQELSAGLLAIPTNPVSPVSQSLNEDGKTTIAHLGTPRENLVPNRVDYLDFIVGRVRRCSHIENK